MADGPGEDSFEALRARRDEARTWRGDGADKPAGRRAGGRWRVGALALLAIGGLAAALALLPAVGERGLPRPWAGRPAAAPPAPPAPATAEAGALAALADRLATLEARLARVPERVPEPAPTAIAAAPGASGEPVAALAARLAALEADARRLAETEAATAAALAALRNDLASAGVTSGAVAAATSEVRDIFLVLALRRFLDRGRPLGAFDPLLRQQFETREPSAVAALLAWSSAPLGRAALAGQLAALDGAAEARAAGPGAAAEGFWARLWRRVAGVVEVRQGAEEAAAPLVRARARIAEGDLPAAIALVAAAPETPERARWLDDARRLQAAEDALERIELLVVQSAAAQSAAVPAAR